MKVILKENIENLGKKGDIVDVSPGYGRNYLLPQKKALAVTPTNLKMVEIEQKALQKSYEKDVASYQDTIQKLNQTTLTFQRKAGEKDSIFGSVSLTDIKEELDKQGLEIEKKKILLEEPLKRLGNYTIDVKVYHDEKAEIKVEVLKEGAEEKPAEKTSPPEEKKDVSEKKEEPEKPEEKEVPEKNEGKEPPAAPPAIKKGKAAPQKKAEPEKTNIKTEKKKEKVVKSEVEKSPEKKEKTKKTQTGKED